jgi:hypothetical protein
LPFRSTCSSRSKCGTCSYYRYRIRCCGGGRRMHSILPSLATSSSSRGNWRSCPSPPPQGSSSTSCYLAKIDARPKRGWRGGGFHSHHASHSTTRQKRPCNIFWLAAHSLGGCCTRCYHGSDPRLDHQGREITSWDGGRELQDLPLPPVIYARGLHR